MQLRPNAAQLVKIIRFGTTPDFLDFDGKQIPLGSTAVDYHVWIYCRTFVVVRQNLLRVVLQTLGLVAVTVVFAINLPLGIGRGDTCPICELVHTPNTSIKFIYLNNNEFI